MQYFQALQIGQARIRDAVSMLKRYTGNALPAIALRENRGSGRGWEPVGEENLYSIVEGEHGLIICLCDAEGNAKAIASWYSREEAEGIAARMRADSIQEYTGKVRLPV
ncbi:MAG: hypothetical protein NZ888_05605 [Candidatus Nitrosocaldus sp.]|nr:hypothetical protein [Candidatus Nitrosocaldus sp.]MDW8000609.1 hypothetical protein [Candidatus Nitrosocaldus sp.]